MPNLWIERDEKSWALLALDHDRYVIESSRAGHDGEPLTIRPAEPDEVVLPPKFELRRVPNNQQAADWALVGAGDVAVNAVPVPIALRLLRDKDELRFGRRLRAFYSTESAAKVEPFPGPDTVICARCRLPVDTDQPAVKCPNSDCGVWHHQIDDPGDEQPCWTFAETCGACMQPTDLSNGFRWTPSGL